MPLRSLALALAAMGVGIFAGPAPAEAAYYHSPSSEATLRRAYAECNARLAYRGWPQRYLALEGCVQDMRRR